MQQNKASKLISFPHRLDDLLKNSLPDTLFSGFMNCASLNCTYMTLAVVQWKHAPSELLPPFSKTYSESETHSKSADMQQKQANEVELEVEYQ